MLLEHSKIIGILLTALVTATVTWTLYRIKVNQLHKDMKKLKEWKDELPDIAEIKKWKDEYPDKMEEKFEKQADALKGVNDKTKEVASELKHNREYTSKTLEKIETLMLDLLKGNNNG